MLLSDGGGGGWHDIHGGYEDGDHGLVCRGPDPCQYGPWPVLCPVSIVHSVIVITRQWEVTATRPLERVSNYTRTSSRWSSGPRSVSWPWSTWSPASTRSPPLSPTWWVSPTWSCYQSSSLSWESQCCVTVVYHQCQPARYSHTVSIALLGHQWAGLYYHCHLDHDCLLTNSCLNTCMATAIGTTKVGQLLICNSTD